MFLSRETLIYWVKWGIALELSILLLFLLSFLTAKLYFQYKKKVHKKRDLILNHIVSKAIAMNKDLTAKEIGYAKRNLKLLLELMHIFEKNVLNSAEKKIKKQLIFEVLLPRARRLTHAKSWFKRYLAAQCFQYGKEEDDKKISKLMQDAIPLVSYNAAKAALMHPSKELIETLIEVFSKSRNAQKRSLHPLILKSKAVIDPFINKEVYEIFSR